jgi:quinol monooxygenase YgiN
MHIQIINFQLNGIDEQQYREVCDQIAPAFAAVPGLLSKVWLADQPTNTYGGVYTWRDRQAMQAYLDSDLFRGIVANPHLIGATSRDFSVLEAPSEVTRGLALAHV